MSFHNSAESIVLLDNHILKAKLKNAQGDFLEASIDLDQIIGNNDGVFAWDGENFSHTAAGVTLVREGGDGVPVLRASLESANGNVVPANLNLTERIENIDGRFEFV